MASRIFWRASSRVRPWDQQLLREGQWATMKPSSPGSRTTFSSIAHYSSSGFGDRPRLENLLRPGINPEPLPKPLDLRDGRGLVALPQLAEPGHAERGEGETEEAEPVPQPTIAPDIQRAAPAKLK